MLDAYRLLASFAFLSFILEAFVAQQTTSREPKSYRVSILPLSPSIKLNSPYYAECRVEPQPPKGVEFAWYFNGRFHSEGERLSIPELNEYNIGEYTCQANIHTSSGTPLIAKTRALIQYQPISPEHADLETYTVSIVPLTQRIEHRAPYYAACRIQPRPRYPVRFTWYYKGRYHSEGQRLRIPQLNELTAGKYTCQAIIDMPSETQPVSRRSVYYVNTLPGDSGQVQVSIVPLTQQMEQGRAFYADGRITPRPSVPVEYTWYFKDRVFSRGERLSIPELNEYWFGDYTCQASFRPTGGLPVEANATISLRFNPSASVDRSAPQTYWVSIDSLTERPARGSPYYADCRLQPQPPYPVRLTWYFKGRFHSEGQRLSIRELNEYTTGEYTCQAMVSPPSGTPLIINATKPIYYAANQCSTGHNLDARLRSIIISDHHTYSVDESVSDGHYTQNTGRIQVSIVPLTQQVERNKPFYAECRLSPRPSVPVDYTWYFQGRAFSRGERLSIRELNENTVGDYICLARFRPVGGSDAEMKATISILFNSSPSSGRNDQQTYVVSIDPLTRRPTQRAPYYADCRIQPRPPYPLRFTWYFKGRYHSDGQRLSISELNSYTTGEYICQVTITPPTGSPLVANATRSIYYNSVLPPGGADHQTYWVSIDPLTQRIEPGAPYYAECRIQPRPRYPVRFNWYFKERHHSQGERLSIPELNEYTTGEYTCQAAIERPSGSPLLVNATRTVNYNNPSPGDSDHQTYWVSIDALTQRIEPRAPYYAECRIQPRPRYPVRFNWYFKERHHSQGERLSIPELNEYTTGEYTCQAAIERPSGSPLLVNATRTVNYNNPSPGDSGNFVLSVVRHTEKMEHNRPFYADCRLSPRPSVPVDYTWYFQGRVFSRGERLSIRELNEYTVGDYTCQARFRPTGGSTVEAKATISLRYDSSPSDGRTAYWVSINPLTERPARGSPYYADCRLQPQPPYPVRLTWYFKGRYHSEGQRLSIRELNEYTSGAYTCQATITPPTGTPVTVNVTKPIYYAAVPSPDVTGKFISS
ncbi:unnamed protein product [Schistocephalus solidus]|uniref:Basement membrane-specific heparan sulfate proteoglycan core protein n=1 Tax=Schistocephalus solidus TaxID=70667 RepID=A0A183S723_SCHSO|nr:unnamed protein product [Schistocephalus solidus]